MKPLFSRSSSFDKRIVASVRVISYDEPFVHALLKLGGNEGKIPHDDYEVILMDTSADEVFCNLIFGTEEAARIFATGLIVAYDCANYAEDNS